MEKITYETFKTSIVDRLEPLLGLTRQETEKYVDSEEEEVRSRFDTYKKEYEQGKITEKIFLGSCVDSVGLCLYMMY